MRQSHPQPRIRNVERDHRRTSVEFPQASLGHPLHRHLVAGQERLNGHAERGRGESWQLDLPMGPGQLAGQCPRRRRYHVEHIEAGRQGGVERLLHLVRIAGSGESDLEVLRFARCPGGRRVRVRDSWMR
jgi:hypothetical protein